MTESVTRLHISPLTPALLDSVLNPSIRPLATDISFHNIPTFPENDYGFVTLPTMEAEKLKKKLNGSILKGKKFKVEAAREDPTKKKAAKIEKDASVTQTKTSSKRKAEDAENSVLDGYELPTGRLVKRGWTEPASAKRLKKQKKADKEASQTKLQPKSKYTDKAECLFKTKVPLNKISGTDSKKVQSKKPSAPNEVVVHEFAKTYTHPSFLKSSVGGQPITAKFEEGKGWVDEDGNVLEEMSSKKSQTADFFPGKKDGAKERAVIKAKCQESVKKEKENLPSPAETSTSEDEDQESDWTSSSGSSEGDSSDSENDSDSDSDSSSSSGISSIDDEKIEVSKSTQVTIKSRASRNDEENEGTGKSTGSSVSGQEDGSRIEPASSSDGADNTAENKEVHPLEALFKRTQSEKNVSESAQPTFSFFAENDDDIESEEEERVRVPLEPLTPFTKHDRQIRGLRSGAPTPDTAVFNRRKLLLPESGDENDEDEDRDMDDDYDYKQSLDQETPSKFRAQTDSQRQPEESDFVKWFWENRGDNNRAWKRRRREAAKEKRQRENRRKGLKGRG